MSTTYRIPTLDYEDLRSPTIDDEYSFQIRSSEEEPLGQESGFGTTEHTGNSRRLFDILAENRRLQRENESLRHCLILTKEHCDLKTANYVASALAWCDDRLRQNYNDFSVFKASQEPGLSTESSAFKPVTPKPKSTGQQTRSANEKLYAEDWVERNAALLNKHMPDPQPWHMTLRKYDGPSATSGPKSGHKIKPKSASYSGGRSSGRSGKSKRSSIPIPVQRIEFESADNELSRQGSFGFDTQSNFRPPSPRTVLFNGDGNSAVRNSTRRSPASRQSQSTRQSPSPRRSPTPSGRQSSPVHRRGRSQSPDRSPVGRQTKTSAFESSQPMESGMYTMVHTGRRSPPPTTQPSYTVRQPSYSSPVNHRSPSPTGRSSPSPTGRSVSPPGGRPLPFSVGQPSPTSGRTSPMPGSRHSPPLVSQLYPGYPGRKSPSPTGRVSPDGRYNPPPAGRPLPFSVGRQSPSPNGRVSPTPTGRYTPPPPPGRPLPFSTERPASALPFGLPESARYGRLTPGISPATTRRQSPSPDRMSHQQSPSTRGRSPITSFDSPVDPHVPHESLVDKAVRSQLMLDSPTLQPTTTVSHTRTARSASVPPGHRPSTPLTVRASSPWSMLSDSHPVIEQAPTTRSPKAVTIVRSPTPRSPSPGKLRQGSPKLFGVEPLKPAPLFTEQKFRSRSADVHRTQHSSLTYETPRRNYDTSRDTSEGYGSHSYTSPSRRSRNYDLIGQPVAASTPLTNFEKRNRSPQRNILAETSYTNDYSYRQPADSYRQPAEPYRQPTESYRQSAVSYRPPADSYRQPAESYRQPAESYKQPVESYRQPSESYRQPVESYRPPAESYREPDEAFQEDSLAQLMGMSGSGAGEKARGVVYRAVDTLTGYRPNLTAEVKFNLSQAKHNKRIVGEIAFQLDRRILEYVFAANRSRKKNARYYGYSLTNIMQMIYKESAKAGFHNPRIELDLRERLDSILRKLAPFGYNLDQHAEKSQDMVNKYGLLNGPPDQNTVRGFGLDDPAVLRVVLTKVIRDENELNDMLVMLDCLCYLSYQDGEPIFMW